MLNVTGKEVAVTALLLALTVLLGWMLCDVCQVSSQWRFWSTFAAGIAVFGSARLLNHHRLGTAH